MANTIMSAKNTFAEGLIMDFAPDNTQATCLTSALNATLLTFNGNELSLQNDMGNGRVETAMLPEGYIPVGTCEFGDIIYIVSYNPLTDKSQIGCFPSPERNISSDEISDLGQQLSYTDFQDEIPNGGLKNTTAKKVLISKNINPGDKYVIYTDQGSLYNSNLNITYEEEEKEGKKSYVRLSVVSIDDSGKITKLDTECKKYKQPYEKADKSTVNFEYFIKEGKQDDSNLSQDIDSYRNLLQSGWNIFTSKVSGKLAILAELIMPESFSCEYYIDYEDGKFYLSLLPSFGEGEDVIKAPYLQVRSIIPERFESKNEVARILEIPNGQNEQNNYVVDTITVPETKGVYTLEVCPVMPYGVIDSLKLTFTIDFNKIGTGEIELTRWKYFNQENVSTLSYGFNAYLRDKETIDSVVMHFYDANGLVAEYKLKDVDINSGIYTENIGLNGNAINATLSKYETIKDEEGNEEKILIKHKKTDEVFERANDDSNDLKDDDNYYCINEKDGDDFILEDGKLKYHLNDAGVLYSNMLYLVKIMFTTKREIIGGNDPKYITLYRWFWTTSMYNEYYHSIDDFNILKFQLSLSADVVYETNNDTYKWETKEINNLEKPIEESNSANIQYIENKTSGNINAYIRPGLQNDYGCFKLYHLLKNDNGEIEKNNFENFTVDIYFGENILNNTNATQYDFSDRDTSVIKGDFMKLEDSATPPNTIITIPESLEASPQNSFNVLPIDIINEGNYEYTTDENGNNIVEYIHITKSLNDFYYVDKNDKQALPLNLQAVLFNKAYAAEEYPTKITKPVYAPIINTQDDLDQLGITIYNGMLGFKTAMALSQRGSDFSATNIYQTELYFDTPNKDDKGNITKTTSNINTSQNQDFIDLVWNKFEGNMPLFFPVYIGGNKNTSSYVLKQGSSDTPINYDWFKQRRPSGSALSSAELTRGDKGVYDINSEGKLDNILEENHITFLGARYKDGLTLFNTAMIDGHNQQGNQFLQKDYNTNAPYSNLAYQLYLIFSNIYHKNKRTDDREINIKNFVRNSQYEAQLKKTIYYRLTASDASEDNRLDIAMHNMSFNNYVTKFQSIKEISTDWESIIKNNITLEFISYLHQSSLQIDVKSQPMSFLNAEQDAYFLRNGNLIGTYNLGEGQFYIYKDGILEPFQSKEVLYFEPGEIQTNFKQLTGEEELLGIKEHSLKYPDEERFEALKIIINYLNNSKNYSEFAKSETVATADLVLSKISEYIDEATGLINNMYKYFEDNNITVQGKSIRGLVPYAIIPTAYAPYYIESPSLPKNIINISVKENFEVVMGVSPDLNVNDFRNTFTINGKSGYWIDHNFNINKNFIYDNGLALNTTTSHNYFGINEKEQNFGYTGFLRDVILDTNYQIK